MRVTLEGIVTRVSPLQPANAEYAIHVTLHPPKVDGMEIAPDVERGIAYELPPNCALPSYTVYVHVIPPTVSVAAKPDPDASRMLTKHARSKAL